MKLSLGALGLLAGALAVGCSTATVDDPTSDESNVESARAIAPGKYVVDGKVLMVYGACSASNFLGEAAKGAIDASGVMHAEEGDVCGGYGLAATAEGEVTVTWNRDPSAHLDAASIAACKSNEGRYLLMQPSAFTDAKPGTYAKPNSAATITIPAGCATPVQLSGGGAVIARSKDDAEHPAGFLGVDEGNVCSGYTYSAQPDGTVKVTWAPPSNASIAHDLGVSAACKSVEGVYKPR